MSIKTRVQTLEKKAELLPEVNLMKKHIWNRKQLEIIEKEVLAFFRIFPGRIEMEPPIPPGGFSLQEEGAFWLSNHSKIQVMIGVLCSYDNIEDEIFSHPELSELTTMLKKYPRFKGRKKNGTQR